MQAMVSLMHCFRPVKFQNALMMCKACFNPTNAAPNFVAISDQNCSGPYWIIPIQDRRQDKLTYNMTVCLHKALVHGYRNITQFVEWMEVNKIFGADKIAIYNYTGHSKLIPYINHYINRGLLDYHKWDLHGIDKDVPRYLGQGAVIDDCIYQYMYRTKYLMLIDVDEVVVPQKPHNTWIAMIQSESNPCRDATDMLARNSFFIHQQELDRDYTSQPFHQVLQLNTLALTKRYNFTYPCVHRSKIIMQPRYAKTANVHYALQMTSGNWGQKCCLSPSLARLHHYRFWKRPMREEWVLEVQRQLTSFNPKWDNFIRDQRMHDFADVIMQRVIDTYKEVNATFLCYPSDK